MGWKLEYNLFRHWFVFAGMANKEVHSILRSFVKRTAKSADHLIG